MVTEVKLDLVEKLRRQLDEMVNAQFETPEFVALYTTPLTMARARFFAGQMVFYNLNRRDCWAYVQARAPFDVKQDIWRHEEDELIHDERGGGADHITLMTREARLLGMTEQDLANDEPVPLVRAPLLAWLYIASTRHWLSALVSSHFLERRNNGAIVRGGGASQRWREKLVRELGLSTDLLPSSNVHAVADVEHSDLIWDAIARHITDEQAYAAALEGARECAAIDRAFRGGLAYGMRAIE